MLVIKIFLFLFLYSMSVHSKEFKLNTKYLRDTLKNPPVDMEVSYKNHLGEGDNNFASLPRYNPKKVNCTTWWQQLLAESYTNNHSDLLNVLDNIRYYSGLVSFGTRKHFLDHHMFEEPAPLIDVNNKVSRECSDDKIHETNLNINLFKKSTNYQCPLAFEEKSKVVFTFMSPEKAISCLEFLDDGIYFAFPVASPRYLRIWGKKSGPMGLVHGLIINREKNLSTVYHASIDRKKVASESFSHYVRAPGSRLFKGYKIFSIAPSYDPDKEKKFTRENFKNIFSCEFK